MLWHPSDLGVSSLGTEPPGFSAHVPSSPQGIIPRLPFSLQATRRPSPLAAPLPFLRESSQSGPPCCRPRATMAVAPLHPLLGHAVSPPQSLRSQKPSFALQASAFLPSVHALCCEPPKSQPSANGPLSPRPASPHPTEATVTVGTGTDSAARPHPWSPRPSGTVDTPTPAGSWACLETEMLTVRCCPPPASSPAPPGAPPRVLAPRPSAHTPWWAASSCCACPWTGTPAATHFVRAPAWPPRGQGTGATGATGASSPDLPLLPVPRLAVGGTRLRARTAVFVPVPQR